MSVLCSKLGELTEAKAAATVEDSKAVVKLAAGRVGAMVAAREAAGMAWETQKNNKWSGGSLQSVHVRARSTIRELTAELVVRAAAGRAAAMAGAWMEAKAAAERAAEEPSSTPQIVSDRAQTAQE